MMITVAACWMDSQDDTEENLDKALNFISGAGRVVADLIPPSEICSSVEGNEEYSEHAETIPGRTTDVLSGKGKEYEMYFHSGGSRKALIKSIHYTYVNRPGQDIREVLNV